MQEEALGRKFPFFSIPIPFPQSLAFELGLPVSQNRFWMPNHLPPKIDGEMLTENSRAAGANPATSAPRMAWPVFTGLG